MERLAATDGLTGLANRRHFDGVADREWRRCRRERQPLSVLLLDADHFKHFNDRYGHLAGDGCLRAIAGQLAAAARRPGDLAARYGGEEFLLLMPQTDRDGALRMGDRVRELVLDLAIAHEGSPGPGVVTVSIGGATAWPKDSESGPTSVSALLDAADAALYQAKSGGRNQVVIAAE
jgi:diguanylate cyclase (GGDEF)-like protein